MEALTFPHLAALEALRGTSTLLYAAAISEEGIRVVYECLRKQGRVERLDLVLSTVGGNVTTTHQLALLIREYTQHLTILVPYRAKSAGTLLCLCADELILGTMAELGPIDPLVGSSGAPPPDAPGMISAQDIRTFREMAEQWFGVTREEDRLQVLALMAQRFFPTSLSSLYRSDRLVERVANELLMYQLPNVEACARQHIVDQLVRGYPSHDYIVSRAEARKLGLQVRYASQQEEDLLWELLQASRVQWAGQSGQAEEEVIGVIASPRFSARQIQRWIDAPAWKRDPSRDGKTGQSDKVRKIQWEIDS